MRQFEGTAAVVTDTAIAAPDRPFESHLPEIHLDPYPVYAAFREHDPVHRHPVIDPASPGRWYVFRHADVEAALTSRFLGRNPRVPSPTCRQDGPYARLISRWMLFRDPPEHTRLRASVSRAFTPRVVHGMRERIEGIARDLLDRTSGRDGFDLLADFAFPLPVAVISDLIGLRVEDRERFRDWAQAIVAAIDVKRDPASIARADEAATAVDLYFRGVFAEHRAEPRDDLISGLLALEGTDAGLSEEDLVATLILVVSAGHETTTNLIGNGMLALLRHPAELERLRREPALLEPAIDELLRFDGPVQLTTRIALEDCELAGRALRLGDRVHIVLGSANRDPGVFAEPDRLDLSRDASRHMTFGLGTHFCIGTSLARLQGRIAIGALLDRFPELRLRTHAPEWRRDVAFRGLVSLPVSA